MDRVGRWVFLQIDSTASKSFPARESGRARMAKYRLVVDHKGFIQLRFKLESPLMAGKPFFLSRSGFHVPEP